MSENSPTSQGSGSTAHPPGSKGISPRSTPSPNNRVRVIPEIFQDFNDMGYKQSLRELDTALDDACPLIIIEPLRLGDETSRWIAVGNFLHKYTVLVGLASAGALCLLPQRHWLLASPLAASALVSYGVYTLSWAPDPAVKYQLERHPGTLASLRLEEAGSTSAASVIVLRRVDDDRRKLLHTSVSALLLACLVYRAGIAWLAD